MDRNELLAALQKPAPQKTLEDFREEERLARLAEWRRREEAFNETPIVREELQQPRVGDIYTDPVTHSVFRFDGQKWVTS